MSTLLLLANNGAKLDTISLPNLEANAVASFSEVNELRVLLCVPVFLFTNPLAPLSPETPLPAMPVIGVTVDNTLVVGIASAEAIAITGLAAANDICCTTGMFCTTGLASGKFTL